MIKKWNLLGGTAIAALMVVGACSKPAEKEATSPPSATTSGTASPTSEVKPTPESSEKGLDLATVPAELKTEGYQYYGLDYAKPVEFVISQTADSRTITGSSTTRLTAVKNGVASFTSAKTGDLAAQGDEELEARPDGIYNIKIGNEMVKPDQLVMPAELPVGKKWSTKSSVKLSNGKSYSEDLAFKVVGEEDVKTKAGSFKALKIIGNGNISIGGKSSVTSWFVKGIGMVKTTVVTEKPKNTVTVEATKVE